MEFYQETWQINGFLFQSIGYFATKWNIGIIFILFLKTRTNVSFFGEVTQIYSKLYYQKSINIDLQKCSSIKR